MTGHTRMYWQTRLPLFLFLWIVSITTGNSLPKSAHPSSGKRNAVHYDMKVRSVKRARDAPMTTEAKMIPKVDAEMMDDFASVDDEYSNSIPEGPVYTCEEIFAMTDQDGDGVMSEDEYRLGNPNMTETEVTYVFQRYDPDGDGVIHLEDVCNNNIYPENPEGEVAIGDEMLDEGVAGQLPSPMEVDCRTLSMQICDQESFLVVWEQIEENEAADTTVCRALQAHIQCVSRENEYCDLDDYVADVTQTVASFIRSGICPEIHVNDDTISRIPSSSMRQVRSARTGHRTKLSNSLRDTNVDPNTLLRSSHTCLRSAMEPCNTNFVSSLRAVTLDPCSTLVSYRRCARKSTRRCQDRINALRIKDGIKSITRAHRRAKLCE